MLWVALPPIAQEGGQQILSSKKQLLCWKKNWPNNFAALETGQKHTTIWDVFMFGQLQTLCRDRGRQWHFCLELLPPSSSPSSVTVEVLPEQNRTCGPAGCCGWRGCSLNLEQRGIPIPIPSIFINDLIAMQAGTADGSTSLTLHSGWKMQISGWSEAVHMHSRDQVGSKLYTPGQLWGWMHMHRKLKGVQQKAKARTDLKTAQTLNSLPI